VQFHVYYERPRMCGPVSCYLAAMMKLRLGDDKKPGPVLRHVDDALWNELVTQERRHRWLAFGGEDSTVWLRLGTHDGHTKVTGLLIGAEELTSSDLRAIPLGRLLDIAAQYGDDALRMLLPPEQLDQAFTTSIKPKPPGRRGVSSKELDTVARAYTTALGTHPRAPMKQAAALSGRSVAQTRRLVRRAEDEGLLDKQGGKN
jgi:hypothetical protein